MSALHTDGGARPTNPGHAGFACVLDGDVLSRYIGYATNNEAEYCGVIVGLRWAKWQGIREIEVLTDSKLVVEQVLNRWQIKQPYLRPFVTEVQNLLLYFEDWDIRHIKRAENAEADDYCTKAINWGRNQNPWVPEKIKAKRPGEVHDPFNVSSYFSSPLARPEMRRILWDTAPKST